MMRRLPSLLVTAVVTLVTCLAPAGHAATGETAGPTRDRAVVLETAPRRPVAAVIDEYVKQGLASNLALQSADLEVERGQAALDAAETALLARIERIKALRREELALLAEPAGKAQG